MTNARDDILSCSPTLSYPSPHILNNSHPPLSLPPTRCKAPKGSTKDRNLDFQMFRQSSVTYTT